MTVNFLPLIKTGTQASSEKRADRRMRGISQGWLTPMEIDKQMEMGADNSQIQRKVNLKYWSNMISVMRIRDTGLPNNPPISLLLKESVLVKQLL